MSRGSHLTKEEQAQIRAFKIAGWSNRMISSKLKRSLNCINQFINNPDHYERMKNTGAPKKLTERDKRGIVRLASNTMKSCNDIKNELGLNISKTTVWRAIDQSPEIVRAKLVPAPRLTLRHKDNRLTFAKANMATDWDKIIFSDEKKFNLDGPDGYNSYWHDIRKDQLRFPKRNFGGGRVMIMLPSTSANHQKIGSKATKSKFWIGQRVLLILIRWKTYGELVRRVYAQGKKYDTVDQLKDAIETEWNKIDKNYLKRLVDSMPNRLYDVISKHGGPTKY
ncbi:unnamed protein product [Caenorhabditis angaria]|uniref:Tc3 transposase DNA binding domain-containing protein n=1 Tax=Caenorhabditis angaria TaxID=860376 RepID=A0A9P1IFA1_9PELO|nr:unnamed protein product [Caenorhabditis angaria]